MQTPFDPGWRARVDERSAPVLKVDAGLMGVPLAAGEHRVNLHYIPAFLSISTTLTLISLATLILCAWKWPRVPSLA